VLPTHLSKSHYVQQSYHQNAWWCQITQRHTWIGSCIRCLTGCNNVSRSSGSSRITSCRWSSIDCPCNSVSDILMLFTLKLQKSYTNWKFSHMRWYCFMHWSLEIKICCLYFRPSKTIQKHFAFHLPARK